MNPNSFLISTDFDGTLYDERATVPVPNAVLDSIRRWRQQGACWIINTGRDMQSLLQLLHDAQVSDRPDYLITVEREIHKQDQVGYQPHVDWNTQCSLHHQNLFDSIRNEIHEIRNWVKREFRASVYEDDWSPFCLIASSPEEAHQISHHVLELQSAFPDLDIMVNHVYARLCHRRYNKGSALEEVGRITGVPPQRRLAAGDHHNDLPMLHPERAAHLIAPSNAVPDVAKQVRSAGGFLSQHPCGQGVAEGLNHFWRQHFNFS